MVGNKVPLPYVLLALHQAMFAVQLPVRTYSAADGLPSNFITAISKDSRGYLWIATREGLSHFDGYEFTNYTRANGLPRNTVTDFLETRAGEYWVITSAGAARFEPNAPGTIRFRVFAPAEPQGRRMNVIYQDRSGELWCGTDGGLFRMRPRDPARRDFEFERVPVAGPDSKTHPDERVISVFEDSRGDFWVGTFTTLYRRSKESISEFHLPRWAHSPTDELWNQILEDRQGRLWAATGVGLWRLDPSADTYRLTPVLVPGKRLVVVNLLEDSAGTLWMATSGGLYECAGGGDACARGGRLYTQAHGLSYRDLNSLATDAAGNLWVGTDGGGVMKVSRGGLVTYTASDGVSFSSGMKPSLFHDRSGAVHVAFERNLNVRHGEHFVEVRPAISRKTRTAAWGWHQTVLQDRDGEWWIATGEGLARFPNVTVDALNGARPLAIYTTRDGLRTNDIFRIFEDRRGGIWVACIGPAGVNGLSRWDRATGRFESVPAHDSTTASAFAEDPEGDVWIGYYDGALVRYRDGRTTVFTQKDGIAGGGIQAVHVDHARRLWIASTGGLTRATGIKTPQPHFERFGAEHGLSSNIVLCLDEDRSGRLYLATSHGIDALAPAGDVEPGRVSHYSEADGLARGEIRDVVFDRDGTLWCATTEGISRFHPDPESATPVLPVLLRGLRVRGIPVARWDLGMALAPQMTLGPDQNQLEIAFAAPRFSDDGPRYHYRLDGADQDWSPSTPLRSVNYSNVPPGRYRFQVRSSSGNQSAPAVLEFTVLAPVWARSWFRLLLLAVASAALWWVHGLRTARLLELERVRTRIATDLHDDIGSGLSQIAILSEVARANARRHTDGMEGALGEIGSLSRELSESMNDIVWSVNPRRDYARDLAQRMRRFASDVLSGKGIEFDFRSTVPEEEINFSPEVRRDVYLIFKEAVNNLVRHSSCTRARIEISISAGYLELKIQDDGNGLRERCDTAGHGLINMRERARRIGGQIEFGHGMLGGHQVWVRAPVRMRRSVAQST